MKVDKDALIAWINANAVEDGVVIPPIEPPVDPPPVEPPPVQGAYTAIIAKAYKLNQQIKTPDGQPTSFGWGFNDGCVPGPVYCKPGDTYFFLDTSWRSFYSGLLKWKNMNVAAGSPSQHTTLIRLDENDNGAVVGDSDGKQAMFSIKTKGRYIVKVTSVGINLSINW